jgi:hypothetical protein
MGEEREKVCEACGATFTCCGGDCWCDDVKVEAETQADLRRRYADCLCPHCLKAAAAGLRGPAANPE